MGHFVSIFGKEFFEDIKSLYFSKFNSKTHVLALEGAANALGEASKHLTTMDDLGLLDKSIKYLFSNKEKSVFCCFFERLP